jgi:hypothetical protein
LEHRSALARHRREIVDASAAIVESDTQPKAAKHLNDATLVSIEAPAILSGCSPARARRQFSRSCRCRASVLSRTKFAATFGSEPSITSPVSIETFTSCSA